VTALRRALLRGGLSLLLSMFAGSVAILPVAADSAPATASNWAELVVQVTPGKGYTIADVTSRFALKTQRTLVRSSAIYLLRTTTAGDAADVDALIDRLMVSGLVSNAAPEPKAGYNATRFHSWQKGRPVTVGTDSGAYLTQPIAADLSASHAISRGSGVTVAVLDTGVADHPALTGRLVAGYDYVEDDNKPTEQLQRVDTSGDGRLDSSYGHGTFVSGLVGLIAPNAQIMPMRVLDSDGVGNVVVIAQAIRDAVRQGAGVVNLSFGTESNRTSPVLDRALRDAKAAGAMVIVSAGNGASSLTLYPGDSTDVLSVTSFNPKTRAIDGYASYGVWVDVAACGTDVIGPVPGRAYASWSGTSMAAPLVSGQAALVRSRAPRLSLIGQVDALTKTATSIGPKTVQYGAVDIPASLKYASRT